MAATWTTHQNRATNAQYAINGTNVPTVNQERNPNDYLANDRLWEVLGQATVTGAGTLNVTLTDIGANDYLIDNVRRLHEALQEAGVDHTWLLNEGQHADDYWVENLEDYLYWYAGPWSNSRRTYPPCESPSSLLSLNQMSTANTTTPKMDNMINFINPVANMAINPKARLTA